MIISVISNKYDIMPEFTLDALAPILKENAAREIIISVNTLYINSTVLKIAQANNIPIRLYLPYPHIKKAKNFSTNLSGVSEIVNVSKEYNLNCWDILNKRVANDSDLIVVAARRHNIIKHAVKYRKPVINLWKVLNASQQSHSKTPWIDSF